MRGVFTTQGKQSIRIGIGLDGICIKTRIGNGIFNIKRIGTFRIILDRDDFIIDIHAGRNNARLSF